MIGGFRRPREAAAAGSLHASFLICQALAKEGGYSELHLYQDDPRIVGRENLVVPPSPPTRVLGKAMLSAAVDTYSAIYVANGEQAFSVPFVLRPHRDWAPVICSVGTTTPAPSGKTCTPLWPAAAFAPATASFSSRRPPAICSATSGMTGASGWV